MTQNINKYIFISLTFLLASNSCSQDLWKHLKDYRNSPAMQDSVKSMYKTALDSLVPITFGPYDNEIAFRIIHEVNWGHREYSFIFRSDFLNWHCIEVLVSEAEGNSIQYQLAMLFQNNPKLSKAEALLKVKVRHKLLKAEDHPELDTLMRSVFSVQFSIPHLAEREIYLDPPTEEIRIQNESIKADLKIVPRDHPIVNWALDIKKELDDIK
jgi:hypothetical protein